MFHLFSVVPPPIPPLGRYALRSYCLPRSQQVGKHGTDYLSGSRPTPARAPLLLPTLDRSAAPTVAKNGDSEIREVPSPGQARQPMALPQIHSPLHHSSPPPPSLPRSSPPSFLPLPIEASPPGPFFLFHLLFLVDIVS